MTKGCLRWRKRTVRSRCGIPTSWSRENLARTIDTLTERVSPANVAKRAMSRVLDQASRPEVQIGAAVVTAVTVGLVVWWRRRG